MSKSLISICFTIVFVAFLSTPTIITIIDNSIDVSMFYTSSEEEEKGNEKSNNDFEKLFIESHQIEATFVQKEVKENLEYVYINYPKPSLNLISPPPKISHKII